MYVGKNVLTTILDSILMFSHFPISFQSEKISEEETKSAVRHAVSVITFGLCLASVILLFFALGIFSFFKYDDDDDTIS